MCEILFHPLKQSGMCVSWASGFVKIYNSGSKFFKRKLRCEINHIEDIYMLQATIQKFEVGLIFFYVYVFE